MTNHPERLLREFRTKSDGIGAFPYETSCVTGFFLVIEHDHAEHVRKIYGENFVALNVCLICQKQSETMYVYEVSMKRRPVLSISYKDVINIK